METLAKVNRLSRSSAIVLAGCLIAACGSKKDRVPNEFSFTDQSDVALSTEFTSNAITIQGINRAATISVSGGEYSIDGGDYTSAQGTVSSGQQVSLRVTSSAEFSSPSNVTLTIGGVSDTFSVTTLAADTSPTAFSFAAQTDVAFDQDITSNSITVAEINTPAPISIVGGSYTINGGDPMTDGSSVAIDSEVAVIVRSSASAGTPTEATLTIGDMESTFTVTTIPDSTAPTASIEFPPPVSMTEGSSVTIRGTSADDITGVASITILVNGDETPVDASAQTVMDYSTWSQSVDLSDGANDIVVRVTDVAGNTADSAATVSVFKGNIDDGSTASAYPDDVNPFSYPVSIAIDAARDRILVGDRDIDAILAVDMATGARTVLSDPTTPDDVNTFNSPVGMLIDPVAENNRVFVGDISEDKIYTVDLTTGARTVLSDDVTPDANLPFNSPREMIVNPNDSNEILVADQNGGVKGFATDTGVRRVFSDDNPTDGRPNEENPFDRVTGIAYDSVNDRVLVVDSFIDAVVAVSLEDGARTYISDAVTPDDTNLLVNPRSLVIDEAGNRAIINDVGSDGAVTGIPGLLSMDMDSGAREFFSSPAVPNSNNALVEPREVHWDGAMGYFLVIDRGLNALMAVDVVSGERVIYSKGSSCSDGSC